MPTEVALSQTDVRDKCRTNRSPPTQLGAAAVHLSCKCAPALWQVSIHAEKQREMWQNMYDKEQSDIRKYAYGYNDPRDGAHPDGKQFKDFEEALFSSSRTKFAKIATMWLFFVMIFTGIPGAVMMAKEEERNELKNKSDFERMFVQENLRSKSELKNMDRYFGSSSNNKEPK